MSDFRLIEILDPRRPDDSIIRPTAISQTWLIQGSDDPAFLFAIATVRNAYATLFRPGHMNFTSMGGGRLALQLWRRWLTEKHVPMPDLLFAQKGIYEDMVASGVVQPPRRRSCPPALSAIVVAHRRWVAGEPEW